MTLEHKRILLTGGTGFIGGRAIERLVLEEKANVRVLVRSYSSAARLARFPVEIVLGDLTNEESVRAAVKGCDAVLNCAHETLFDPATKELTAITAARVLGEAVLTESVPRVVHLSSSAVYGDTKSGDLDETTQWGPADHEYTFAKRDVEKFLAQMFVEKGVPVVILQPTIVYGPYGAAWTEGPLKQLKTGLVPLVDGGEGLCNAVYVDDVVDAMFTAALAEDIDGETILVSGAQPVTWRDFYAAFEAIIGQKSTVDMPYGQLFEMYQREQAAKRPINRFIANIRDPKVLWKISDWMVFRQMKQLVRLTTSEKRRSTLGARMVKKPSRPGPNKQLHTPNPTLLGLYSPKTHMKIDKARRLLNYDPQFSFERGMSITAEYARWARLS